MPAYLQIMGMTPDAFMNHNYDQAQTELRNSFTLAKIAELENLEATDERVEEELENAAKMYGISVEDYKSYIPENYADDMKADLKLQMALELLGENAVETEAATKAAEEAMKSEAEEAVKAVAEEAAEEPAQAEAEPEEKKEEE